jgi:hypothetical protein
VVFFLFPEIARSRTSDAVVSSKSERGERRDRPLAGCHDRADAADAEGVNLAKSDFGEAKTRRAKVETK